MRDCKQRHSLPHAAWKVEVLPFVVGGFLNKQAAAKPGISETTLQSHRSRLMRKMQAESVAQLVRMAAVLAVPLPQVQPH